MLGKLKQYHALRRWVRSSVHKLWFIADQDREDVEHEVFVRLWQRYVWNLELKALGFDVPPLTRRAVAWAIRAQAYRSAEAVRPNRRLALVEELDDRVSSAAAMEPSKIDDADEMEHCVQRLTLQERLDLVVAGVIAERGRYDAGDVKRLCDKWGVSDSSELRSRLADGCAKEIIMTFSEALGIADGDMRKMVEASDAVGEAHNKHSKRGQRARLAAATLAILMCTIFSQPARADHIHRGIQTTAAHMVEDHIH